MLLLFGPGSVASGDAAYPASLDEVKAHLRVGDDEDSLLTGYIAAATAHVEDRLGRSLMVQELTLNLSRFPQCRAHPIELPRGPVRDVVQVSYTDTDGTERTFDGVQISKTFAGANLLPPVGGSWPSVQCGKSDAVRIAYTAGYGAASDVPQPIRQAILLLVADFYERRTETITGTIVAKLGAVEMLLNPYRVLRGV